MIGSRFRTNLHFQFFIHAAVDSVQHGFREVSASAEELHLLTNNHRAYAACDSVVVVVEVRTHQVIVLILQRRGIDGHFSGEFLEAQRQFSDHRIVMFGPETAPWCTGCSGSGSCFWSPEYGRQRPYCRWIPLPKSGRRRTVHHIPGVRRKRTIRSFMTRWSTISARLAR